MPLVIALEAANGCIEPYDPKVIQTDYSFLVVNGFLVAGPDPTVITLGHTQTLAGTRDEIVEETGAAVQVLDDNGYSVMLRNNKDGTYTGENLNLDLSKTYALRIKTQNGKEYASDFVSIKSSPHLDTVMWSEGEKGIQVSLSTSDPDNKTKYYMWTYEETWKYSSAFYSLYKVENGEIKPRDISNELYFCWRSAASSSISIHTTLALSQDVVSNYKLHLIPEGDRKLEYEYSMLVKQHALTKEAYEYWETLKKNNELKGTLFDPMPSQDIGNIYCTSHPGEPALGYFSASTVSKKRIFIDRDEIIGLRSGFTTSDYSYCEAKFLPLSKAVQLGPTGFLILDKKFDDTTQALEGYTIAQEGCVDCRKLGGTLTRPAFWR